MIRTPAGDNSTLLNSPSSAVVINRFKHIVLMFVYKDLNGLQIRTEASQIPILLYYRLDIFRLFHILAPICAYVENGTILHSLVSFC